MADADTERPARRISLVTQATLRSGRRSTYVSSLSVQPVPKAREEALSARQRELYAQLRAEAEDETAGARRAPPRGVVLPAEARGLGRRRTAAPPSGSAAQTSRGDGVKSGRRAAASRVSPPVAEKPTSARGGQRQAHAGRRAPGAAGSAAALAVDRVNLQRLNKELGLEPEPEPEPAPGTSRTKKKRPDLFSRLAAGPATGAPKHGRHRIRSFGASKAASDAIAMRRQLEGMASQMRKMHSNANQDQRRWEERRQGSQERIEKLMHETRRAIGHDLHNDMVAHERAKLRNARMMPKQLRKHANSWAAFEEAVAAGLEVIGLGDIPFPPLDNPLCLPPGQQTSKQVKLAFRQSSLRWHPDKFAQRYLRRCRESLQPPSHHTHTTLCNLCGWNA